MKDAFNIVFLVFSLAWSHNGQAQSKDIILDLSEVQINTIDIPIYISIENTNRENSTLGELGLIQGRILLII